MIRINEVFKKPSVICICGGVHTGKSMLAGHIINTLQLTKQFNLYIYGFRVNVEGAQKVYSISELEQIKNSLIVIDEFANLVNIDDKKNKGKIERIIRLINHNNNILVLICIGENMKKFLAGKVDQWFFKKVLIDDLINGSRAKKIVTNYSGVERGSEVLDLAVDKALFFDGLHYDFLSVPYLEKFDVKKDNVPLLVDKKNPLKNPLNHP